MIIPYNKKAFGIIIEFKTAEENQNLLEAALKQINDRYYVAHLVQLGCKNIIKIGMAVFVNG